MSSFLSVANHFFKMGFNAIPLIPESKEKKPYVAWAQYKTSRQDYCLLTSWAQQYPQANIGVLLGDSSEFSARALYVIDVDDMSELQWVIDTFGSSPLRVKSGRPEGGMHLYYRGTPGMSTFIGIDGRKVDFLGNGRYVVAPGSKHFSGSAYRVEGESLFSLKFEDLPVLDMEKVKSIVGIAKGQSVAATGSVRCDSGVRVTTAKGVVVDLEDAMASLEEGEYISVICPFHDDQKPSAAIYSNGLKCFTENKFFRPSSSIDTFLDCILSKGHADKDCVAGEKQYVPDLCATSKRIVVNTYPMGHGKTFQVARLAKLFDKVLAIGPTQALTSELAHKLALEDYSDVEAGELSADKLALCLPSLIRLALNSAGKARKFGLVVLDEFCQLLALLHSPLMVDQGSKASTTCAAYQTICYILRNAEKIVVNDAYFSPAALEELKRMIGADVEEEIEWVCPPTSYKPLAGWTEYQMDSKASLIDLIIKSATDGKKGVVSCDTKSDVEIITSILNQQGVSVIGLHSESPASVKAKLKDATENLGKYDWIVHNQAAGSGVSLEMQGYMSFVIGDVHLGTDGAQLRQLSGRLRFPVGKERFSFISRGSLGSKELDRDIVRSTELAIAQKTEDIVISVVDDVAVKSIRNPEVVMSRADIKWYKNMTSVNCHQWYYSSLAFEGANIVAVVGDDSTKEVGQLVKDTHDSITVEKVEAFKAARDMTREEALTVDKHSSDEDKLAAEKHWHGEFFGDAGMVDEVISSREKYREQVQLLVDVRAPRELVAYAEMKAAVVDYRAPHEVHTALFTGRTIRRDIISTILVLAGYSLEMIRDMEGLDKVVFGSHTFNEDVLNSLLQMDKEYSFKQVIGLTCPDKVSKISGFVCKVLEKIGLATKRGKKEISGRMVNVRSVTTESLEFAKALSEKLYSKTCKPTDKEVDGIDNWKGWGAPQKPIANAPVVVKTKKKSALDSCPF